MPITGKVFTLTPLLGPRPQNRLTMGEQLGVQHPSKQCILVFTLTRSIPPVRLNPTHKPLQVDNLGKGRTLRLSDPRQVILLLRRNTFIPNPRRNTVANTRTPLERRSMVVPPPKLAIPFLSLPIGTSVPVRQAQPPTPLILVCSRAFYSPRSSPFLSWASTTPDKLPPLY